MPRRSARPEPNRTIELAASIRRLPRVRPQALGRQQAEPRGGEARGPRAAAAAGLQLPQPRVPRFKACLRPEGEGRFALPQQEFWLDVIALAGRLRHGGRRRVPEIHAELDRRGVGVSVRSVGDLVDRYNELLALACVDPERLRAVVAPQGRAILAIDGLQPPLVDAGRPDDAAR